VVVQLSGLYFAGGLHRVYEGSELLLEVRACHSSCRGKLFIPSELGRWRLNCWSWARFLSMSFESGFLLERWQKDKSSCLGGWKIGSCKVDLEEACYVSMTHVHAIFM